MRVASGMEWKLGVKAERQSLWRASTPLYRARVEQSPIACIPIFCRVIVDFHAICAASTAEHPGSQIIPTGRIPAVFGRHQRLLHRLPYDDARRQGCKVDR